MKRYEIWRAKVKYEDQNTIEERPVLVWNETTFFVIAYKMTGTNRGNNREEFTIEHWRESGLIKPTSIRISKLLKLNENDFVSKMGNLDYRDRLRFELRISG